MEHASGLSEVQIAELKKAFAICDRDGNGYIDGHELKEVFTLITDQTPTEQELQTLLAAVDKDRNGRIEWEEFVTAMGAWLADDNKGKSGAQKRKASYDERQEVHKKVKSFFQQFKQDSQFEKIRRELSNSTGPMDSLDIYGEIMDVDGVMISKWNSEAKLKFLLEYRATMNNIQNVINALTDAFKQLEALSCISKLLSIVDVFRSPTERRAVAEDIVRIFEVIVRGSLTPILLRFADSTLNPQIQLEALRSLTYFAPGPRIASTPEDSLLHSKQMFFKKLILAENGLAVFVKQLNSPHVEIREQAVLAVGAIAAHNHETRDYVLGNNVLGPLLSQIHQQSPVTMLRKVAWTLSVLCGVTHSLSHLPPWEYISPILQPLASLLFANDEEILCTVCPALAIILPGVPEMLLCRRLVALLATSSARLVKEALKTITSIIRFDNIQTGVFVHNCNLLLALKALLKNFTDDGVRMEVAETLLVLVGLKGEVQGLINAQLTTVIIDLLIHDDNLKFRLAKILKYVTRGNSIQIRHLVDSGIVGALCRSLSAFKSYDRVLTSIYKYYGPTYNFEFARDVLVALDNIVNVGDVEVEGTKGINKYALVFDLEAVDKLGSLLKVIKDNPHREEVNAWRMQRPDDTSLEDKVIHLLAKIERVWEVESSHNDRAKPMLNAIREITKVTTEGSKQAVVTTNKNLVLIKAVLEDDIRVVTVPKNISLAELKKGLEFKYGIQGIKLCYQDEEKDYITIDSQPILQKAFEKHAEAGKSVKMRVIPPAPEGSLKTPPSTPTKASEPGAPSKMIESSSPIDRRYDIPLFNSPFFSPSLQRKRSTLDDPTDPNSNDNNATPRKKLETAFDVKELTQPPKTFNFTLEDIKRESVKNLFEGLSDSTHFGKDEVEKLYSKWKSQSPDGELDREAFGNGLKGIGVTDPLVIEQYFSAFDNNKDGKINFKEFVTGLSVVQRGTLDERLKFMFKAYDTNGDGVLSPSEVFDLFQATTRSKGKNLTDKQILDMVNQCFKEVDVNHDGTISFEEFKVAVNSQKIVLDSFVNLTY